MEEFIFLLLGIGLGSLLTWLIASLYFASKMAIYKANNENLKEKVAEKQQEISLLQEKITTEFKSIATEILEEKSRKITEQSHFSLKNILDPFGEKLSDFRKKVEETYDREAKERFSLEKEIKNLQQLNQQISKEANNLATALKGQSKIQGNWGEMILESILEKSGLEKEREYFLQKSHTTDNGKRLQPDVLISLPNQKYLIIDAKVSLNAYERFCASEENEQERTQYLKQHLAAVRQHIIELSQKNYQNLYANQSPDFVLMFLPIEPAFSLAVQHDADLLNLAFERGVVLVSATTLLACLRTVASIWRQEKQNRYAEEIAKEGGMLYEKAVGLVNELKDLGLKIQYTQNAYEEVMLKLSTGKGNLLSRIEKMKALGIKTNKSLSPNLFEEGELDK
ncbi:DNA recombination protein RmuC [Thermoflexibacter ruber]|uniref:DNA recombination protein RmuC n=1 Tax=Thermoflexibacter ruber TaxID=1003 RepID=A0A1I2HPJ9_9BACT|nr:DNA recombination protein RmuC [Thermoflexibacter ruber]SFF31448.1 DNA recombination protein RmuC [Thermoflexibacter ruber]